MAQLNSFNPSNNVPILEDKKGATSEKEEAKEIF